jgi:hypothetical protein
MKHSARNGSLLFAAAAVACICAGFLAHANNAVRADRDTAALRKASAPAVSPAPLCVPDSALFVPVTQWVNRKFVVLAKQKLFRQFGYEFYLSKSLAAATAPVDTSIETSKRHLRSDKLAGATLAVTSVEPAGAEFLVTFTLDQNGRQVFAKTRKGAIEGIACASDLDSATKKWVRKTVYSRRGFIGTYDSATGAYGKITVKIQDKLKVTGVSWGLTPLPPRPLWLLVETAGKEKGFIPAGISWTNTMENEILPQQPWAEELFESNPADLYKWDSLTWSAVNRHTIVSGMTKEQVTVSWGRPHSVVTDTSRRSCPQQWLYGSQYVCFNHDSVVSVGAR